MAKGYYWYRWKVEDEWNVVWMDINSAKNPGVYIPIKEPTGMKGSISVGSSEEPRGTIDCSICPLRERGAYDRRRLA